MYGENQKANEVAAGGITLKIGDVFIVCDDPVESKFTFPCATVMQFEKFGEEWYAHLCRPYAYVDALSHRPIYSSENYSISVKRLLDGSGCHRISQGFIMEVR